MHTVADSAACCTCDAWALCTCWFTCLAGLLPAHCGGVEGPARCGMLPLMLRERRPARQLAASAGGGVDQPRHDASGGRVCGSHAGPGSRCAVHDVHAAHVWDVCSVCAACRDWPQAHAVLSRPAHVCVRGLAFASRADSALSAPSFCTSPMAGANSRLLNYRWCLTGV